MVFIYGKMAFMNAIAEIDKAGRVVVPKKFRDALHLVPGTRLSLRHRTLWNGLRRTVKRA